MAYLGADGLETSDAAWFDTITGTPLVAGTYARSGDYGLQLNSGTEEVMKSGIAVDMGTYEWWIGFAYNPRTGYDNATRIMAFGSEDDTSSQQYTVLRQTSSGALDLFIGAGLGQFTTQVGTTSAAGVLTADAWHWIEIGYKPHATTGFLRVYVNGTKVSGPGTDSGDTAVDVSMPSGANGKIEVIGDTGSEFWFDDFVTWTSETVGSDPFDSGPMGEMEIEALRPSADTADADFTSTEGSNYLAVNDDPFADAQYNGSAVATDRDIFDYTNRSHTGTPLAITLATRALKSDAGAKTYAPVLVGSSTEVQATETLSETAGWVFNNFPVDIDGTVWDNTAVDGVQAGYDVVT